MTGRGRADDGKYYAVGGTETGIAEREETNQMREETMERAIKKIKVMDKKIFACKVLQYQKEILMDRKRIERDQRRNRRHNSDEEEDSYELRCIKCNQMACLATDVRKVEDSHHVVMDLFLLNLVDVEPHPRPVPFGEDFNKIGKLFCKDCHEDWGIQAIYRGVKLQVIKISALAVVNPDGERGIFKKWKQVPFGVGALNYPDELEAYASELNGTSN